MFAQQPTYLVQAFPRIALLAVGELPGLAEFRCVPFAAQLFDLLVDGPCLILAALGQFLQTLPSLVVVGADLLDGLGYVLSTCMRAVTAHGWGPPGKKTLPMRLATVHQKHPIGSFATNSRASPRD